jgi:hypothetical protein
MGSGLFGATGFFGQSCTLVGLNERAIHAARNGSKRSASCCQATRSAASS